MMQPSPPKAQKIKKSTHRPFYEPVKKTSAEIISEARSSVRALETKRPFTPAETSRTLFEQRSEREGRPPSAISISSSYTDSRPPTGKRLTPIHGVSDLNDVGSRVLLEEEEEYENGDLNNNDSLSIFNSNIERSISPKPPKSSEPKFSKSTRRPVVQRRTTAPASLIEGDRRVQSGPKERTQNHEQIVKRSSSFNDLSKENNLSQDKNTIYFETNIRPLLKQMELNHLHEDVEALLVNFDVLWKTLKIENMLGKTKLGSKRRSEILTSVFKCTNHGNAHLLLKLSRLFLALEVSGKNLDVVCKLLFKVSRNKRYDLLFIEEDLIEPLVKLFDKSSEMNLTNCLVYLAGALKFLTLNKKILDELLKHNILKNISYLLCYTKDELSSDVKLNKESCHMLVQVTSALSNVANIESQRRIFISQDIVVLLLQLSVSRYKDSDYFLNIARIFSKLTMNEQVCAEVKKVEDGYNTLLCGLKLHYKNKDIAVRMCYAFGNIADFMENSRHHIYETLNGKDIFLQVLKHYNNCLMKILKGQEISDKAKEKNEIEDVLIKVIRVVANLSIDGKCGELFSESSDLVEVFADLLGRDSEISDQLVINIAATINNLSFYSNSNSALMEKHLQFSEVFAQLTLSENMECVSEMVRVLGNFTQSKQTRLLLLKNKVFEVIVALLDSNNPDLISSACGVLINMMVDEATRPIFKASGGIAKLIEILKDLAESDWILAGMVCQVLWNYSEKITRAVDVFGVHETDDLLTVLNELLEPELALDYENNENIQEETIEFLMTSWEENFKPVAFSLLQRIESHHSELEPLVAEPD